LNADVAAHLLADRQTAQDLIPYPRMRGRAREALLQYYPGLGLQGEPRETSAPSMRWSILPLRTDDLRLFGSLETSRLSSGRYVPFLASVLGARNTYLLLWLPLP
jgi:hypothetical protein